MAITPFKEILDVHILNEIDMHILSEIKTIVFTAHRFEFKISHFFLDFTILFQFLVKI